MVSATKDSAEWLRGGGWGSANELLSVLLSFMLFGVS
jgi:hypothetical protein